MANLGTKLFTIFFGVKVGTDEFGNVYYKTRKPNDYIGKYGKERRWVIYKGKSEASKIPASWHGWIHYTFDEIPDEKVLKDKYKLLTVCSTYSIFFIEKITVASPNIIIPIMLIL